MIKITNKLTSDWFLRKDDLLYLRINLDQYLSVGVIQHLIIVDQWLQLEETQFLDTLGGLGRETSAHNLHC